MDALAVGLAMKMGSLIDGIEVVVVLLGGLILVLVQPWASHRTSLLYDSQARSFHV